MPRNQEMISIRFDESKQLPVIIDQRLLPHKLVFAHLTNLEDACIAIKDMWVRGAPLIGVTAAFGIYLALKNRKEESARSCFEQAASSLSQTRPTAVNLFWAIEEQRKALSAIDFDEQLILSESLKKAIHIRNDDAERCRLIGEHGKDLIRAIWEKEQKTVNILTHCNAGWLATSDWGTATAPMYAAHLEGIPIHIWVDETRPRNQGARLTAWELGQSNIPHTIISDNTGGHLMQNDLVDLCLVGSDRTCRNGDVANKIGTYLKALAAFDNQIPFYVALPASTIDFELMNGKQIPIEKRAENELSHIWGMSKAGFEQIRIGPKESAFENYAFDVTPAKYVTGLITERGIAKANEAGIQELFPEKM